MSGCADADAGRPEVELARPGFRRGNEIPGVLDAQVGRNHQHQRCAADLRHASDVAVALAQPTYAARLLRGDMQVLSRHAAAVVTSYDVSPLVTLAASWVGNPLDGSGVVTPNVTVTPGDRVSVVTAAYLPYGTVLRDGRLGACALFYGLARTFCEFFREPDPQLGFLWGGLTMGMLLSVPLMLIGIWLIQWASKRPPLRQG